MQDPIQFLHIVAKYPHLLGHLVGKDKLTDLHSDWIKHLWESEEHAALQAHRGSYKTTSCTEIGIVWWLLFHPSDRIALIRETFTEADKTRKTVNKYIEAEPIQILFEIAHGMRPKAVTDGNGVTTFNFKGTVTKEGSINAHGIEQIPTGSHYDKIVCDDIVTINSRLSRAKRERVKQGVLEIVTNIIDPGKQVLFVGTPWHKDDAWSLEGQNGKKVIPEPLKFDVHSTGILDENEIEEKKATTTHSLYSANYLLKHEADENLIFSDYKTAPFSPKPQHRLFAHVDSAFGGEDTTAVTLMYSDLETSTIHVIGTTYTRHVQDEIPNIQEWIWKWANNRSVRVFTETNADKGIIAGMLEARRPNRGRLIVTPYHESQNKHHKIITILKKYWRYMYFDERSCPNYLMQIYDYQEGSHPDDAPDSLASLLRAVLWRDDPDNPETNAGALYT